ncbi:hypothetical protein SAMN05444412_11694 [Rhodonellum ikkaensis]|uniref:Uncharacterized protein n=1 Tax=Rhodonellum ikkaensis TaxID=336829 RepID=A0A1H3TDJ0_9BACT|nr:hypothetical protein SAMN05444412_11694 [Rhodonellum ikkaensis]
MKDKCTFYAIFIIIPEIYRYAISMFIAFPHFGFSEKNPMSQTYFCINPRFDKNPAISRLNHRL